MSLTACVIAKNEAQGIERCLESIIDVVDEVVFVDTGSADDTIDIARSFGSKVRLYNEAWRDDFSYMYNFAFDKVRTKYCMLWDADFMLRQNSKEPMKKLVSENFYGHDSISLRWNIEFDAQSHPTVFVYRPLVFKTGHFRWKYPTHSMAFSKDGSDHQGIEKDIEVDHLINQESRKQTTLKHMELVRGYLNEYPNDLYMRFALIEELYSNQEFEKVIEQGVEVLAKHHQFPFLIQLLEIVFFSYLNRFDVVSATKLIISYKDTLLHTSRKYDILLADTLLYSDLEAAKKLFLYAVDSDNYTFDQNDEYDSARLQHALECSMF